MANMLRSSMEHAADDAGARMLAEARVDAERLVDALTMALEADGLLLTEDERDGLEALWTRCALWLRAVRLKQSGSKRRH